VRAECRRRIPAAGVALAAGVPEIPDRTWASSAGTSSGCTGARKEAAEGGKEAISEEKELITARNPLRTWTRVQFYTARAKQGRNRRSVLRASYYPHFRELA